MFKVLHPHRFSKTDNVPSSYGKMMSECMHILTANQSCTLTEHLQRWSLFVSDFAFIPSFCFVAWYYKYTSGISELYPFTPTGTYDTQKNSPEMSHLPTVFTGKVLMCTFGHPIRLKPYHIHYTGCVLPQNMWFWRFWHLVHQKHRWRWDHSALLLWHMQLRTWVAATVEVGVIGKWCRYGCDVMWCQCNVM